MTSQASPPAPQQGTSPHGKPGAPVCEGCLTWERFGRKCWVYWDDKKICTQYLDTTGKKPSGYRNAGVLWMPFQL